MTLIFPLCAGADLRLCASCDRLAERHPQAAESPHQAWVAPGNVGERCPRWRATPAPLTFAPRIDTGD